MSVRADAYVKIWGISTSDKTPIFLGEDKEFEIAQPTPGNYTLKITMSIGNKNPVFTFPLNFDPLADFMHAPVFNFPHDTIHHYRINFKLASPASLNRAAPTLYCTVQTDTHTPTGELQDSEQGVFGAEEEGGGDDQPAR